MAVWADWIHTRHWILKIDLTCYYKCNMECPINVTSIGIKSMSNIHHFKTATKMFAGWDVARKKSTNYALAFRKNFIAVTKYTNANTTYKHEKWYGRESIHKTVSWYDAEHYYIQRLHLISDIDADLINDIKPKRPI